MKQSLLAIAALMLAGAAPAQSVTKLAATKANDYGLVYSLPETVVNVTLRAECTIEKPGEFYKYAERFLGRAACADAVREARTKWVLTDAAITADARIAQGAAPYAMQFKNGQNVYVLTSDFGFPLTINTEDALLPDADPANLTERPLSPSPLDSEAARYAVTEEMLASPSPSKRAQLAADQIMQLRQSRQDYLTGQAESMPDGKALEMILANINAQEEALTAMFLGTRQTRAEVTEVSYVPRENSQADVVIARINPLTGFVAADDLSGEPIYLMYDVTARGTLPQTEKGEAKEFPKGGIPYCIPGSATVSIDFEGERIASESMEVTQAGVVFGLDPAFFTNKKAPGYAVFNPLTGAIRELGTKE